MLDSVLRTIVAKRPIRLSLSPRIWLLSGVLWWSHAAWGLHLDIELWSDESGRLHAGFCRNQAIVGCDLPDLGGVLSLPSGTLPIDGVRNLNIFIASFGDDCRPTTSPLCQARAHRTDNPGWQAASGALISGEVIRYEAVGRLLFWNNGERVWTYLVPDDSRVRLSGGLDRRQIAVDPSQCGGALICLKDEFVESQTVFTARGIEGVRQLIVDDVRPDGSFHAHLDWFLDQPNGQAGGPVGAYLVELRLISDRRTAPSESVLILFNHGLAANDFGAALQARMAGAAAEGENPDSLAPQAKAGPDRVWRQGAPLRLDGSLSVDPEPGPKRLRYRWLADSGNPAGGTLRGAASKVATFVPRSPGRFVYRLSVTDGETSSEPDDIAITVPKLGDVDQDGDTDGSDLALLEAVFGSRVPSGDLRDLNGDRRVDRRDAARLKKLCSVPNCGR